MTQRFAFICPGGGSQNVGMGKALAQSFPEAMDIFKQADDVLEYLLCKLCFEGPAEQLSDNSNFQSAIFVMNVAAACVLLARLGQSAKPAMVASHSLGEYSALVIANALSFTDALKLIKSKNPLKKLIWSARLQDN